MDGHGWVALSEQAGTSSTSSNRHGSEMRESAQPQVGVLEDARAQARARNIPRTVDPE